MFLVHVSESAMTDVRLPRVRSRLAGLMSSGGRCRWLPAAECQAGRIRSPRNLGQLQDRGVSELTLNL